MLLVRFWSFLAKIKLLSEKWANNRPKSRNLKKLPIGALLNGIRKFLDYEKFSDLRFLKPGNLISYSRQILRKLNFDILTFERFPDRFWQKLLLKIYLTFLKF